MDMELNRKWNDLLESMSVQFGEKPNLDAIIFLVGVQELGQGYREFTKDEKLEVMHIGICRLLSAFGHYIYEGMDEDGWPHYRLASQMPAMGAFKQEEYMKRAILEYFEKREKMN